MVQGVVVPNVSLRGTRPVYSFPEGRTLTPDRLEHELEQFEDDPLEYIRLDLALPSMSGGGDAVTVLHVHRTY